MTEGYRSALTAVSRSTAAAYLALSAGQATVDDRLPRGGHGDR